MTRVNTDSIPINLTIPGSRIKDLPSAVLKLVTTACLSYLTGSNCKPMPRTSKYSGSWSKKSSKLQLEGLYRKCRYCNTHRPTNRFDKHQKACKTQWEIFHERRKTKATQEAMDILVEPKAPSKGYHSEPGFVEGSSAIPVDSLDSDMNIVDDFPCLSPPPSPCANGFAAMKQTGEYKHILYRDIIQLQVIP